MAKHATLRRMRMPTRATLVLLLLAVVPTADAATYTWTGGGGADTNWSNGSNWGGSAPSNGEAGVSLIFPALGGPYTSSNDRNGLQVTSIAVTTAIGNGDYLFTGNSITLAGAVTMESPSSGDPNLVWQIPIALAGDVTLRSSGRQTQIQAAIQLGSRTLTLDAEGDIVLAGVISGSGNLVKNNSSALTVTGANTYTGSTTCNRGAYYIDNAAALGGDGTGTTFTGGVLSFAPGSTFTLSEPLVFTGGSILAYGAPKISGPITLGAIVAVQPFELDSVLRISGALSGAGGLHKTGPAA